MNAAPRAWVLTTLIVPWVIASSSAVARAAPADLELAWNAPDGCPTPLEVRAQVDRMLAGSPITSGATAGHVRARADVTQLAPARWSVELRTEVDGAAGERSFEADSCAALANATALIVAWAVTPSSGEPPPAAPAVPPVEPSPPKTTPPPPQVTASRGSPWAGWLAATWQGDLGTFPKVDAGADLALGATLGRWRAEVSGTLWLEQDALENPSEGTQLHIAQGQVRGCWQALRGRSADIGPCLGAGIAHLSSDGFGETTPYRQGAWWAIARGDVLAGWTLVGPVRLRALVGAVVPLARPTVVITGSPGGDLVLHRPAAVAGQAGLGLEVHFP